MVVPYGWYPLQRNSAARAARNLDFCRLWRFLFNRQDFHILLGFSGSFSFGGRHDQWPGLRPLMYTVQYFFSGLNFFPDALYLLCAGSDHWRSIAAGRSGTALRVTRDNRVLRGHDLPLPCVFTQASNWPRENGSAGEARCLSSWGNVGIASRRSPS